MLKNKFCAADAKVAGLLAAAFLVCLLYLPQFYVGFYNDDAGYLLAARSLLQGRYVMLQVPHEPSMIHFLPGYPLFLAPFVKLATPHWALLKMTTVMLTLLQVVLVWKLLRDWASPRVQLIASALFALNPATAFYSGSLMSDPFFLALILLVLQVMRETTANETGAGAWWLGLWLGMCVITRPVGALLIPCVGLGLAWERRWRTFGKAMIIGALIGGVWAARNYHAGQTSTDYVSFLKGSLILVAREGLGVENSWRVAASLFSLLIPFWGTLALRSAFSRLAIAGCLALTAWGFKSLSEKSSDREGLLVTIGSFCIGYFLVLTWWTAQDDRYCVLLLPFGLLFFIEGAADLLQRLPWPGICQGFGLAMVVSGTLLQHVDTLRRVWNHSRPSQFSCPQATFDWIRRNTSPDAVFLGRASAIYLYTGRQGYGGLMAKDIDEFRYRLLRRGVQFVFLQDEKVNFVAGHGTGFVDQAIMAEQTARWTAAWPEAFSRVYDNSAESTAIFHVIPDDRFMAVYRKKISS